MTEELEQLKKNTNAINNQKESLEKTCASLLQAMERIESLTRKTQSLDESMADSSRLLKVYKEEIAGQLKSFKAYIDNSLKESNGETQDFAKEIYSKFNDMHRELLNSNTKMDDLVTRMIDAQTNMNQALLAQLMEVKKEDSLIEKVEKEIECENEKQETLAKVSKNITLDGKWTIIKKVIPYILAIGYAVYDLFLSKGG